MVLETFSFITENCDKTSGYVYKFLMLKICPVLGSIFKVSSGKEVGTEPKVFIL